MSVQAQGPGPRREIEEVVLSDSNSDSDSESSYEGPDDDDEVDDDSASIGSAARGVEHTLEDAIRSASLARLRTVLLQMCSDNAVCRHLASKALLVAAPALAPEPKTGMKRLRKAYEMCSQCGTEYEVEENERVKGLCVYHPGEKELDFESDFWADHDPNCHGDPDSFIDDPDYAEGFLWSCCDEEGGAEGCERTRHRPERSNRARHV
ncbi:uncharacterized protein PV07_03196 [Cladophialophora immunda]|uniref:C2H2-type domain-containing protein n=1 Tax=Cladophialophora immunda TaxID=569365 RepID=A0A0D2D782_9EURO|nr:uncharacterized protein PV07_03196 [Cladophialophora immunda]KIW31559.1 hypothetical protein PV07_03196 [Cladophialophora immunda]